ncbi:hypothetical protein [Nevskia sp.]|uniref:HoxN/HupN/NixA family nickel/cobalt transporter n=1 Tax=Nevskia sp. TaxID=1929292 RepID=UPI0025E57021|nr:hypothetical protein [Nevskia sp.]
MSEWSVLVFGFLLGVQHATDSDHIAAVAALTTRQNSLPQALRQGVAWGFGHALTLFLLGGTVLVLGRALPQQFVPLLEMAVGVMLVALGVDVLRRLAGNPMHVHRHRHGPGEREHFHSHLHGGPTPVAPPRAAGLEFSALQFRPDQRAAIHGMAPHVHPEIPGLPLRALLVGMMHGMAGTAALTVMTLQQATSITSGLLYIALFGAGSIAGMALLSLAIAVPLRLSAGSVTLLHRVLTGAVGAISIGIGIWTLISTGITLSQAP